jgi:hypothetical protein
MLNRCVKVLSQNTQGAAWLKVYEGLPQGLPSFCMLSVLYLDECFREIKKPWDQSYPFVDDNTLLVIPQVWGNRKAFIARVAGINQKIKAMYSLYDAELSEAKSFMIPIHFWPKELCLGGNKFVDSRPILGIVARRKGKLSANHAQLLQKLR